MDRSSCRWSCIHKVESFQTFSNMSGLADGLFSRMCAKYNFQKPNDRRALDLMNAAAKAVVVELPEVIIAYGVSDEFR